VQALSDNLPYRLNISEAQRSWWVTKDDGTGQNTFARVNTEFGKESVLPDGITMTSDIAAVDGQKYITFMPDGHTDVCTIRLQSGGNYVDVACETPMGVYHVAGAPLAGGSVRMAGVF